MRKVVGGRRERSLHRQPFIDLETRHVPDAVQGAWPYYDPSLQQAYESVWEAFEKSGRSLLILGHPGAGKSTTMVLIAENLLGQATADNDAPIPFIVNLSKFQFPATGDGEKRLLSLFGKRPAATSIGPKFFEEWLISQMSSSFKPLDEPTARRWLDEHRIAILLDGLDEFDDARRAELVELLNETYLCDHLGKPIVICCRINEYTVLGAQEKTTLRLEGSVELQPLTRHQVNKYLEAAGATSLMRAVQADPQLEELARTPLMLAVLAMAYGRDSTAEVVHEARLSDMRFRVFEAYVERMLRRQAQRREQDQDAKEVAEGRYLYSSETIDRCLGWLAITLSVRNRTSFSPRAMMRMLLLEHRREGDSPTSFIAYLTLGVPMALGLAVAIAPLVPFTLMGFLVAAAYIVGAWILLPLLVTANSNMLGVLVGIVLVGAIFGGVGAIFVELAQWLPLSPYQIVTVFVWLILLAAFYFPPWIGYKRHGLQPVWKMVMWQVAHILLLLIAAATIWFVLGDWSLNDSRGSVLALWSAMVGSLLSWIIVSMTWARIAYGSHVLRGSAYGSLKTWQTIGLVIGLTAFLGFVLTSATAFILFADIEWHAFIAGCCALMLITYAVSKGPSAPYVITGTGAGALIMCGAGIAGNISGSAVALVLLLLFFAIVYLAPWPSSVIFVFRIGVTQAFDTLDRYVLSPVALVLVAAMRRLPFRSADFVKAAMGAFLLTESSKEIEFIHKFLRDYFALRTLLPQLTSGDDGRLQAIAKLGYQGQAALDTLVDIADTDEVPGCRAAAIEALSHIPSPEASHRFELSVADRASEVRYSLIKAASTLPTFNKTKLLDAITPLGDGTEARALVSSNLHYFGEESVRRLLERSGKAAVDELLKTLKDEKTLPNRAAVALGFLSLLDDDRITPAMCVQLVSRNEQIRSAAVQSLAARGDSSALDALRGHAKDLHTSEGFRLELRNAIQALETGTHWRGTAVYPFVVIGFQEEMDPKEPRVVGLHLAQESEYELKYSDYVTHGITDAIAKELRRRLDPLIQETPALPAPSVDGKKPIWVRPEVIVQVAIADSSVEAEPRRLTIKRLAPD
jgi:hypothetical protein